MAAIAPQAPSAKYVRALCYAWNFLYADPEPADKCVYQPFGLVWSSLACSEARPDCSRPVVVEIVARLRWQIHFFFPTLRPDVLPSSTEVVEDVKTRVMGTVQTPMGPMDKTLHLVLVEGLTALCKAKPSGLDAIRWIGQWLIDNNPRHGRVTNLMTPRAGGGGAPAGPRVELPHDDARHSESKMEEAEVISTEST